MNYKNPNLFPNKNLLKKLDDFYVPPLNGRDPEVPRQYKMYGREYFHIPDRLTGAYNPNIANKIRLMKLRYALTEDEFFPIKYAQDSIVYDNFKSKKNSDTYQYPQYGVPSNCPPLSMNQMTKAWWTHGLY